ncbi:hypothetical protein GCM10007103_19410 [Salinimicrobium marinum]|uniref:Cell surface protein n=2 Tax=Salinimicrobium marinum TaxID=680283 RepID=A0A918SFK2_9FLAO|nr:hypothetical protein GCM10007103_19410 [Salinimicrobium marinum]
MEFANPEYQKDYDLMINDTLLLKPEVLNLPQTVSFSWILNDDKISSQQNLKQVMTESGTFKLEFKAVADSDSISRLFQITVNDPYELYFRPKTESSSEYISEIIEYKPAPGQYINATYGTPEDAEKIIGGKSKILSLGAWGGYVIFSFDHTIENKSDTKDFVVYGNAMNGLSEPGIVQVSFDENGNGLADDAWYELLGSAHKAEETILNYEVTYTNPGEYANVPWVDNQETKDSVMVNAYHKQNYYPLFIDEQEAVTFAGTRIYPTVKLEGFASIDALDWGYVDNYDSEYSVHGGNAMEIDWAVDEEWNPVNLKGIDFVKVYTGAQENVGWLGEISTEIKGASDLSMLR